MNSTALGAEKENINFISEAHEKFYYEKIQKVREADVYHKALCYCRQKNSGSEWVVSCNGWLPAFLYSGNFIQQNKTKGRSVNDSKDLCIYVVDCNQVDRFIFYRNLPDFLVKKTLHKQLTFDKKYVCFKITNSARYEWGSRYGKRKERETDTQEKDDGCYADQCDVKYPCSGDCVIYDNPNDTE